MLKGQENGFYLHTILFIVGGCPAVLDAVESLTRNVHISHQGAFELHCFHCKDKAKFYRVKRVMGKVAFIVIVPIPRGTTKTCMKTLYYRRKDFHIRLCVPGWRDQILA